MGVSNRNHVQEKNSGRPCSRLARRAAWPAFARPRHKPTTKEAIKELLDATPFRPFTLRLKDGRSCPAPARDFTSLSPIGRTLVVFTAEGNGVRLLDVALVIEIEASAAA